MSLKSDQTEIMKNSKMPNLHLVVDHYTVVCITTCGQKDDMLRHVRKDHMFPRGWETSCYVMCELPLLFDFRKSLSSHWTAESLQFCAHAICMIQAEPEVLSYLVGVDPMLTAFTDLGSNSLSYSHHIVAVKGDIFSN